jgi:hypothetical protein
MSLRMASLMVENASFFYRVTARYLARQTGILISLRFASGCAGHIEILPTTGLAEERYELFGDDFRACATTMGGRGPSMRKSNLSPRVLKVMGREKERRSGYGCHCRGRRA